MTMSFYVGKDYRIYEKKYKEISLSLMKEMERKNIKITKAAVFRFLIDKLHATMNHVKAKKEATE